MNPVGKSGDPPDLPTLDDQSANLNEENVIMARLIVTAFSEDTIAAPGNRQPNYIVASVTAADGTPVTGLGVPNFKVDPMIVGPGGSLVNIVSVTSGRLPGFYHINVVPINTQTWKSGVYIFAVAVTQGTNKGQTLASVLMD